MNQANNIRHMTDHGLADYFSKLGACPPNAVGKCWHTDKPCKTCWYNYLMTEKKEK